MDRLRFLLRDVYGKEFEVAVIVTNDSDSVEQVRIVSLELSLAVRFLDQAQLHPRELRPTRDVYQAHAGGRIRCIPIP